MITPFAEFPCRISKYWMVESAEQQPHTKVLRMSSSYTSLFSHIRNDPFLFLRWCIEKSPAFVICVLPSWACVFLWKKKGKANTRSIERRKKQDSLQIKLNRIYVWFGVSKKRSISDPFQKNQILVRFFSSFFPAFWVISLFLSCT